MGLFIKPKKSRPQEADDCRTGSQMYRRSLSLRLDYDFTVGIVASNEPGVHAGSNAVA